MSVTYSVVLANQEQTLAFSGNWKPLRSVGVFSRTNGLPIELDVSFIDRGFKGKSYSLSKDAPRKAEEDRFQK